MMKPTPFRSAVFATLCAVALAMTGWAMPLRADTPFAGGWTLDAQSSRLHFTSVKKGDIPVVGTFKGLDGSIAEHGLARINVALETVETGIDLRDVRLRFLFFEVFRHPEATITVQLDPAALRGLREARRKTVALDYALSLHGVTVTRHATVVVTLIDEHRVSVVSAAPIPLKLADFDLEDGRRRLEESAGVPIVPVSFVQFDFVFVRSGG